MQHTWITRHETDPNYWSDNEYGQKPETFGDDPHTGPKCRNCGFHFCQFCHRNGWQDDSCGNDNHPTLVNGPAASTLEEALLGTLARTL